MSSVVSIHLSRIIEATAIIASEGIKEMDHPRSPEKAGEYVKAVFTSLCESVEATSKKDKGE